MKPEDRYDSLIAFYATTWGLNPKQIKRQIRTESGFNPKAISKAGAMGLMQFMPATWKDVAVVRENALDPESNIKYGCLYMHHLLTMFSELSLALAAYNWGPGNVSRIRDPKGWPNETQEYVKTCMAYDSEVMTCA